MDKLFTQNLVRAEQLLPGDKYSIAIEPDEIFEVLEKPELLPNGRLFAESRIGGCVPSA